MSETTDTAGPAAVERFLAAVVTGRGFGPGIFAADAEIDATVPNWRFRPTPGDLGAWFAAPGQFEELSRTPLPGGELVEFTLTWEEGGVPFAAHQVHVLTVDAGADTIRADRVLCGGRWDAGLLAEMGAAGHAG